MRVVVAGVIALTIMATVGASTAAAEAVGRSAEGRAISVIGRGDPTAPVTVLVGGSIHGTAPAGGALIRRLPRAAVPPGVRLLLLPPAHPPRLAPRTRQSARGVDLNRNCPFRRRARGRAFDPYYPGRGPASEPEPQALQRLVERERPAVTIWFHQALRL